MNARQRAEWDKVSWALFWVVNSMPNFSKKRRPIIRLNRLNPYTAAERRKVSDTARDASFNAVWNSVEDGPQ